MTLQPPVTPTNLGQLIDRLGRVPPERIRLKPFPGTATEIDLIRPENQLCELIDGTLVEKAKVGWRESILTQILGRYLSEFVYDNNLGIIGGPDLMVRLGQTIFLPDLSFYTSARVPTGLASREPILNGAPDLAIEVMSESNTASEMERKRTAYFAAGSRLVWEIEPELRLVRVYTDATTFTTVNIDGILTTSPALPGFTLSMRILFRYLLSLDPESQP